MDEQEAKALLAEAVLVPCVQAGLVEAKALRQRLIDHEIPALLGRDECCGGGCSPKVQIFVREEDVGRVAQLMQQQWIAEAVREGTFDPAQLKAHSSAPDEDEAGEPPCPACGTAAPLVEGACCECGLQLA